MFIAFWLIPSFILALIAYMEEKDKRFGFAVLVFSLIFTPIAGAAMLVLYSNKIK